VTLPKIIFFDAVGTLFGVRSTVGEIYAQFAAQAGLEVDAQQLNIAFIQSFRTAPRAAFAQITPQITPQVTPQCAPQDLYHLEYDWWRTVAQRSFERMGVLAQLPDFDTFFRPLFTYFETAAPWIIYPETLQTLEMLKTLEIELAIISNFDSRLYLVLQALGIAHWFQSVTISTQVGAAKPDAEIFEVAIAKHPYLPTQAWHVGDSWSEDYEGSTAAGLQGIWLNRNGADVSATSSNLTTPNAKETEVLEISDLTALQKILQP
jgi:putative hydrolase of the HAD superfamily